MQNCSSYVNLLPIEKQQLAAKLIHAIQNDNALFEKGINIIKDAEAKGLYESIDFIPHDIEDMPIPELHFSSVIKHAV